MEEYDHRLLHQNQAQHIGVNADAVDRFPPWSIQETKELLMIRAELDRTFLETKHNRLLWVSLANKMKEKGFNRNHEQCKCKWKNLVTRYKGCETMETEATRQQFPFYNDLHAIFAARMQKNWWVEAEGKPSSGSNSKRKAADLFYDDDPNNNVNNNKESGEEEEEADDMKVLSPAGKKKKMIRKANCGRREKNDGDLKEILKGFVNRQMEMEKLWREAFKVREEERRLKEMEWRKNMEALEREKMITDRMWREKEEKRRERDETRAEKRDVLITALLKKLIR